MARIKYQLTALNPGNIVSGSLCVITRKYNGNSYPYDPSANNYIYNTVGRSASQTESIGNSQYFLGAGICSYKTPYYYISVNSITYTFDAAGKPISSNAANYTLYSAVILNRTIAVGTVIPTNTDATQNLSVSENGATRGSIPESSSSTSPNPETSIVYDDDAKKVVAINQLNARDEFAAAALRGMLNHIDDPSTMSKNEMFYLCDTSYKWAENMMTAAANARAGYNAQGYNADPMNSLIDAVDRDSQLGFTVAAGDGITVNSGQSATYPSNSTFNIALSTNYLNNALNSWKSTNNILSWSSLTTVDTTHKIDASHLPSIGGTFWGNQWSFGGNINGNITMAESTKITMGNIDAITNHAANGNNPSRIQLCSTVGVNTDPVSTIPTYHHLNPISENNYLRFKVNGISEFKGATFFDGYLYIGKEIPGGSTAIALDNAIPFQYYIGDAFRTLITSSYTENNKSVSWGYGTRRYCNTVISGGDTINFTVASIDNGQTETEPKEDNVLQVVYATNNKSYVKVKNSLRIGDAELTWDSSNNALKLQRYDNNTANFYATGGVSSMLPNSNDDKKFYFDSTHYLHVENGVLKYFNGSTDKTVNLT